MTASDRNEAARYEVDGDFAGKREGKTARDLSGGACMPAKADGSRLCLIVNDESRHAQFAAIEGRSIRPGALLPLVGDAADERTLGAPPEAMCRNGEAEFGEFDGEGVAYAAPYFYIAGSHGCSRRGGEIRLSSFMLARVRVDGEGVPVGGDGEALEEDAWGEAVQTTYRLSDLLSRAETVGGYFLKTLDEEANGLNIEGIAVDGARLLMGLRAPSIGGEAFLVAAEIDDLFRPGKDRAQSRPEVIALRLGEDAGIRDLAMLPDGRLLVLAGPAQEQELPFRIFLAEAGGGGAPKELAELEHAEDKDGVTAKAEGMMLLETEAGEARLLILYDGLKNGRPREISVKLD